MISKKTYRYITFSLLGVLAIFIFLFVRSCEKNVELGGLNDVLGDSLRISYNVNGEQEAKIKVFQAEKSKTFLKMNTKDSTIKWLQETVKDYKGRLSTAIVLGNTTRDTGRTIVYIDRWDTLRVGDSTLVFPTYKTEWNERWSQGSIIANKDSIYRDILVKNEYEITLGKQRNGWFKKREFEVQVLNKNPNTATNELRSFNVKVKPKRFTIGVQAGYGYSFRNNNFTPYVGVGFQYTIVPIK